MLDFEGRLFDRKEKTQYYTVLLIADCTWFDTHIYATKRSFKNDESSKLWEIIHFGSYFVK